MRKTCIALLLFAVTFPAVAQSITAEQRRQLGEILPHLLETLYVSPEKGNELARQLRASFAGGRYDTAATVPALAEAINADLASANDRHLGLRFNPAKATAPVLTVAAWNERRAAMRAGQPMQRTLDRDAGRRVNFGVLKAEVLEGNVGYLKMKEFMNTEETRQALSHAMGFLAHTDAMIVDVRDCPGGSADTVSYLASYFFEPGTRVLMKRYNRPMDRSFESTTVDVPGKRLPKTDLYILTGRTGSACESFAFTLQQWGRAKTVGEKTSGAGNNNMFVDVGLGLDFSISIGSAVHPKNGKGFEGIGVIPDIAAPADQALEAALRAIRPAGPAAVAEVRAVERAWLDAYEQRDAEAMNRIVADDFVIEHEDGRRQSKAEVLAMLARGAASGMPAATFTTENVQGNVEGDAVTLTGVVTMQMQRRDGTTSRRQSRYADRYAKRDGRWQVVSSRQLGMTEAAPPAVMPATANLQDYTGKYGVREISVRDGTLYYQRTGGHGGVLKPLARDRFDLNGDVVITFHRASDGAVASMEIQWKDGNRETVARE